MSRLVIKNVLETSEILSNQSIMDCEISESILTDAFNTNHSALEFLCKYRLFRNPMVCLKCDGTVQMSLVKWEKAIDGYKWICKRPCTYTATVRRQSMFFSSKLPMKTLILIFYKYTKGDSVSDIAFDTSICARSVGQWYITVREAIDVYLHDHTTMIGGIQADGTPSVVEID